jgi:hypothetical protein
MMVMMAAAAFFLGFIRQPPRAMARPRTPALSMSQCDFAKTRKQQRLRVTECLVESGEGAGQERVYGHHWSG